ncbi:MULTISPECIES: molybdopterin molybdotransferase MoeA [unclassified Nitratiruptor]|uniref:molybdopterin molybdotransferase MoeA n=1 Tax=unclassified Nitratiruptor TaxID=2624044 RepID=UPI001916A8A1|nr:MULTISPECIES: molybdopterin molybdotransferase MoeA [unclassified Nitratiruptor]BCD60932.1 molybdopterin molybdotransferase [Nitratiruptor sp. YY08-10]BCD64864.1 molybdopterin molybdotransferase [Nitratiruptor sp. YY08-14]
MISFEESMQRLQALDIEPVGVEKRFVTDALHRILAQDIIAQENNPEYPTAAMDGYAIRGKDQALKRLRIVDENPAGTNVQREVGEKEAIKTFTGALMPKGADTLIPIENVRVDGEYIEIVEPVAEGFSVRPVGENYQKGEKLIAKGSKIGFAEIGVMASLNVVMPKLYQKPKVAILATGSEVLEIGQTQTSSAQLRSSNNYTLEAITKAHGGEPIQLGAVKDDKHSITEAMQEALHSADIVVTTGGVSVGDYDFVKDVVKEELGAEVVFKGVVIKPGQHVMVAQKGKKFIVALPGFAFSSTVTFLIYVLPILYRMQGSEYHPKIVYATLKEPFVKRSKKTEFTPCNVINEDGEFFVDFAGNKIGSSAILTNMLGQNKALVITAPNKGDKEAGERVRVWLINQ